MKMLSYLTVLNDPEPPHFIGLEEPENFLHPRLLPELAEVCREASDNSQLLITSHSPFLLNAMKPKEVRILYRDEHGFTQAQQASEIQGIPEQIEQGGKLGDLWMEGFFGVGDPLTNLGGPQSSGRGRG
jgi:predicted ATPase